LYGISTIGSLSKPSTSSPHSSLRLSVAGPRNTLMPRTFTQSRAASKSAAATSKSLMTSNPPKKPVFSPWNSLCRLFWMATMVPAIRPSRRATNIAASECSKKGFLALS